MKKIIFTGSGTALVTPFTEDGIDYAKLEELIEFQISNNTDALIICGTTGEASTMTLEEKKEVIRFSVEIVKKRIPVIAGTGGNCTKDVIILSQYAENVGVDALLLVTPYYNKTTQHGLINHYKIIASSTKLPIIMYNVPSRTGLNILPSTCFELSKIKNIVAIKEASGNISQIAEIAYLCKKNLYIYSGNDDQILPVLSLGGIGVISVISNITPKDVHNMVYDFLKGNITNATKLQLKSFPLVKSLFSEVNPIPIKSALNLLGYNVGVPRLPLIEISNATKEILKKEMLKYGLIKA